MQTIFIILGALLAALAVGLGAIGAHALKSQLMAEQLATYQTAVQYQMYHVIGLVLVGLLGLHQQSRWFDGAGWAMLAGIVLFSGLLYAWLATGRRFFVYPVPVGGVAFIVGWVLMAIGALGLFIVSSVVHAAASAGGPVEHSVQQRIEARGFPSVFQAWNPATNVHDASPLHTVARHDLLWNGPEFFGLKWNNKHVGLADGFDAESVKNSRVFRRKLLNLNPNLILIAEIRYRDAHRSYLPEGHSWWLRDTQGRIVPGWDEGGFFCLDFHNPEFRRQVAKQAKAAVASGAVDGVMLDWWSDGPDALQRLLPVLRSQSAAHARPPPRLVSILEQEPGYAGIGRDGGCRWHDEAGVRCRDGDLQSDGKPNCNGRVSAATDQRGNWTNGKRAPTGEPGRRHLLAAEGPTMMAMKEFKGEKLYVALGASKVRRRLKGYGFGVRKVYSDGKDRAVIIHTATGEHRELEAFFHDVLTTPTDNPQPCPDEDFEP